MSLYNMVAGYNPSTEQIFNLLGLTPAHFGRYRDVYIKDGYIVVHTRNGGGNREEYQDIFDDVSSHPWYSHDVDCDYDETYADIFFTIPEGEAQSVAGLLDQGVPPGERWDALLKALQK